MTLNHKLTTFASSKIRGVLRKITDPPPSLPPPSEFEQRREEKKKKGEMTAKRKREKRREIRKNITFPKKRFGHFIIWGGGKHNLL